MDYTIRIGGEAGQGLQTIGWALGKTFSRLRYHVFTHQDYMSRIRGGHNFYQIRISDKPIHASRDTVHILVAMDRDTIDIHQDFLHEKGVILYDPADIQDKPQEGKFLPTPFAQMAEEEGGNKIMANTVAVGTLLGLFGVETEAAEQVIRQSLHAKSDRIIEGNLKALQAGYQHGRKQEEHGRNFTPGQAGQEEMMFINSTQAIGMGAATAGCKFYSAYPMTPSTGVMTYLAGRKKEYNIVVEQAEDEIAAINMALGASYAGVRAMTGTSGGGFALMTEGVSLAGITETPIVICEMQRPGPATGLPTRTEQGDLLFVIHGGHGEFPKVVLTPGTPEQAFFAVHKAFDLAEKYQIPVFVQGDQYMADAEWTCRKFAVEKLAYRDYRLREKELAGLKEYRRYAYSDNGISPLAVPGDSSHLVVVDSDEHDENGHIIEDAETRVQMVEKRLHQKLPGLRREITPPELYGHQNPRIILIGFGSSHGVIMETVDLLAEKHDIAMLHFSEVYPFPLTDSFDYLKVLQNAGYTLCVEANATGQFARLLRAETGFVCTAGIHKFDGRPFTTDGLLEKITAQIEASCR